MSNKIRFFILNDLYFAVFVFKMNSGASLFNSCLFIYTEKLKMIGDNCFRKEGEGKRAFFAVRMKEISHGRQHRDAPI